MVRRGPRPGAPRAPHPRPRLGPPRCRQGLDRGLCRARLLPDPARGRRVWDQRPPGRTSIRSPGRAHRRLPTRGHRPLQALRVCATRGSASGLRRLCASSSRTAAAERMGDRLRGRARRDAPGEDDDHRLCARPDRRGPCRLRLRSAAGVAAGASQPGPDLPRRIRGRRTLVPAESRRGRRIPDRLRVRRAERRVRRLALDHLLGPLDRRVRADRLERPLSRAGGSPGRRGGRPPDGCNPAGPRRRGPGQATSRSRAPATSAWGSRCP